MSCMILFLARLTMISRIFEWPKKQEKAVVILNRHPFYSNIHTNFNTRAGILLFAI